MHFKLSVPIPIAVEEWTEEVVQGIKGMHVDIFDLFWDLAC